MRGSTLLFFSQGSSQFISSWTKCNLLFHSWSLNQKLLKPRERERYACTGSAKKAQSEDSKVHSPVTGIRPSGKGLLSTHLVISNGFSKASTVQLQVNIRQLVQQLLWLKTVLLWVFNFQVPALRATQLLEVKVQHGC